MTTTVPNILQHPSSIDSYIRHGWNLVPIPMGTKGPRRHGWNKKENALVSHDRLPQGYGIGLAHAYSGTMALDIDHWDRAKGELTKHHINLDELYNAPDAVIINSGVKGHGKLIYAMPFGVALTSKKMIDTDSTGQRYNYLDFRCATANGLTVQDVLPPSIHPTTGKPYSWAGGGHWMRLPLIPQPLLDLWTNLLEKDKERLITTSEPVNASWEELTQALYCISPDCSREEWIQCGMALHWAGSQTNSLDNALWLWRDWSGYSDKYPGDRGILTQWNSFTLEKPTAVTIGTLFHLATRYGWVRPMPDASSLFSSVSAPPMDPLDVLDGLRPREPEMRLDLWPTVLRQRAQEVSESVGCDPIVPLFAGLAAVCGVIDARVRLELMPGFQVPPVLWLMTIGAPADKKSPGSRPMLSPLKSIELEDHPRYRQDVLTYEGKEAAYASAKKAFLEWSAGPEALFNSAQPPVVPEMPKQPVPVKITVSDITSQKLVRHAAERPRGLLCYLDEMNSWVRKLTDTKSSEDRSAWVVAYESEHYEMDRVGAGSIYAENFAVSVFGNIQPQVFRQAIAPLSADGLLQRFIPAILKGKHTRLGHPLPEYMTNSAAWENLLRVVYSLPPQVYRLSTDAYAAYRKFQIWYERAKQDERIAEAGVEYMTAFGKLEGLVGRLTLLFHIIDQPFSLTVGADTVHRVVDLVRGYVIPAYRYALGELGGVMRDDMDKWMIDHIIHISGDTTSVDLRTLVRSARRKLENRPDWQRDRVVLDTMLIMEQAGWVVQTENEFHKRRVSWAINPSLAKMFKEYRATVIKAKQRHADYIYRYAYNKGYERKIVKGYNPETMEE